MRFMVRVRMSNEGGNAAVGAPDFGTMMQAVLKEVGAEAAYFTTVDGQRGGYVIVNLDDASQIPAAAETFFRWLKADVDFWPVMLPEDLAKAGPAIGRAAQRYGAR